MTDVRVDGKFGGTKLDGDKAQYGLLPPDSLKAVAEVMTKGAIKYSANNWIRLELRRILDALERHVNAFNSGEDYASDSEQHHLAHVIANAMMAYHVAMNFKDQDDRLFKYLTPSVTGLDLFEQGEAMRFEAQTVESHIKAESDHSDNGVWYTYTGYDEDAYLTSQKKRSPKTK
jgi:hypothetical protein